MEERTDLGYQQALRYAAELRELYETERARRAELEAAQVKLREAEAKYRALVEHIPAVTYLDVVDSDDPRMVRELYMSPQIEEMLGYAADEVVGNPDMWYRLLHPDDRARAQQEDLKHYDTGEPLDQEYRMVARDGRVVWVRDMAVIVRDDEGRPRYAQGVVFDITERKASEEAMRRYTERLESLRKIDLAILASESIEELIQAALTRLQSLVPCQRATVSLLDFGAGEFTVFASTFMGQTSFAPGVTLPLASLGALGDQLIERLRLGHVDVLEDVAGVADLPPALQTARDEGTRSVLSAPLLSQGDLIGALSLSAVEPSAFHSEHADIVGEVANQLAIAIRQNLLRQELEDELAERTRAEEEATRSEARKSAILESALDCVITMDHEGKILEFNPAAERTFGYKREDVVGKEMAELIIPPSLRQAHREGIARYLATGEGPVLGKRLELTGARADGTEFPVELAITRVDLPGQPVFTGYLRDITERKQAEGRIRETLEDLRRTDEQRQRLLSHLTVAQEEERSRIAADIHDDTIQVMTAVGMRLDILRRELQRPEQTELLEQLEETVTVATARLRNLLFELHPPTLDRDGLATALRVYLEQNLEQTGLAYTLEDRLAGEPPAETRVILYRIAQEALANVRKHARATSATIVLENHEGGFLVRIADDGAGFLQEDARDRVGHLGLASIRERAEMAGGWSRIDSAPGEGTTVEFWLPESRAEAPKG
jgi:PAS domain S-box-containing protein